MAKSRLKPRAVLCDVYGTLLEVGPPLRSADAQWQALFAEFLHGEPPMSRLEFARQTSAVVARHHAAAKAHGIPWPEILWPDIVLAVIPALDRLTAEARAEFILQQMALGRTLQLMPGAADCLQFLRQHGVLLGIASNSQAYTLRELSAALETVGLDLSLFTPALCFWSFANGFSKPDPHVFRMLAARLTGLGITPSEAFMVGDRRDNDIEPAQAQNFSTWHITPAGADNAGDWERFQATLKLLLS